MVQDTTIWMEAFSLATSSEVSVAWRCFIPLSVFIHWWIHKPMGSRWGPNLRSLQKIERLPYPRAPFIILSASVCPQRCAWPWGHSGVGTALMELRAGRTDLHGMAVLQGALASCGPFWKELTLRLWTGRNGCRLLNCPGPPPSTLTLSCRGSSW